jgi:hypothetical protein
VFLSATFETEVERILNLDAPQPKISLNLSRPTSVVTCLLDSTFHPTVFNSSFSFSIGHFGLDF